MRSINCIWCDELIRMNLSWKTIFTLTEQRRICLQCERTLEASATNHCQRCCKQTNETTCLDCLKWTSLYTNNPPLTRNYSLFNYNDALQEMIVRWKYRGDYVIAEAFKHRYITQFKVVFGHLNDVVIVPIPLSSERLLERGFNQAEVLANFLTTTRSGVLKRNHTEKQAKKSRAERLLTTNPFTLRTKIKQPVILIDDIYTTGSTIYHAAQLLKENGCPQVYSYTLARG